MRRVVITSVGVVSRLGNSLESILQSFQAQRPCFIKSSQPPFLYTAPILHFDLKTLLGDNFRNKNMKYLNRGGLLAFAAASLCMRSMRDMRSEERHQSGLFVGAGPNFEWDHAETMALGILCSLPNTLASLLCLAFEFHGESHTLGTACCASLQAIGEAYHKIKFGKLNWALAGGGDSRLSPKALSAYYSAQALFHDPDPDPENINLLDANKNYIPFAQKRYGFIPGEGSAFFLLQDLETALEQKRPIYGEIIGYGLSADGYNATAPHPEGLYAEMAIRKALQESNLLPESVDLISAHGTGTPLNDEMEAKVIQRIFQKEHGQHKQEKGPAIVALKSWLGHLSAACGAIELASILALMKGGYCPPIRHLTKENTISNLNLNLNLNFVRDNRADGQGINSSFETALLQNFGFGGQNAALLIQKWGANAK